MKKSYNKAFTLVELLAVIVILAIILVIAVPKIMDVINSSKKSTLETSAKMIASAAEKTKMQNAVLGKEDEEITCSSVAKLSSNDYDLDNCTITFDKNNNASVTIKGKGKFEGLNVCGGTKNEATAQTGACATPKEYFTYDLYALNSSDITVEDADKCLDYLMTNIALAPTCQDNPDFIKQYVCTDEQRLIYYVPAKDYRAAGLKLSDEAEVGIIITDYNEETGTEVIIPDTIDGYPVVGLQIIPYNTTLNFIVPNTLKDELSSYYSNENHYGEMWDILYFSCPPPYE